MGDRHERHVSELDGGARWPLALEHVTSFDWAADSATLFFTTENDAKRSSKLFRLDPGADAGVLVQEERDEHFDLGIRRAEGRGLLLFETTSITTTETAVLDARTPRGPFSVVAPRVQDLRYSVSERGGELVIVSQDRGPEGRVFTRPIRLPTSSAPGALIKKGGKVTEVVPRREGVPIEGISVFAKYLVIWERVDGQSRPRAIEWATGRSQDLGAQQGVYSARQQLGFDSTRFLYGLESPAQPDAVFERDLVTGETKKVWELKVNGFEPGVYGLRRASRKPDMTFVSPRRPASGSSWRTSA